MNLKQEDAVATEIQPASISFEFETFPLAAASSCLRSLMSKI